MRTAAATLMVFALAAGTAAAQGRGNRANSQGIPPGQMPPPGQCRVWYDGVPPGRQPAPTNCNRAERIAARDRDARVIYGDDRYYDNRSRGSNGVTDAVRDRIRGRNDYPYGGARNSGPAYDNGYRDGLEKGREDARDNDSFDSPQPLSFRGSRLQLALWLEGPVQAGLPRRL